MSAGADYEKRVTAIEWFYFYLKQVTLIKRVEIMKTKIISFALIMLATGCATTNSVPYKASTANIIAIQQKLKDTNAKVNVGTFTTAAGIDENPNCRMLGPVKVAPGKMIAEYIKEAFQEELFTAQVYDQNSTKTINAKIEQLEFSSMSPAAWDIKMSVSTKDFSGYTVSVHYPFETSFAAYSACKNVADAFGPATQELLKQVINDPQFIQLTK